MKFTVRHSVRMPKPALGRGLGALLGGTPSSSSPAPAPAPQTVQAHSEEGVRHVSLDRILPSTLQPRKEFSPEALQELAESIREQGIIQPLIVRPRQEHFELIAGERRWRAAQLLGLKEVPVILREADDRTVLELALIENLQRENLNALEEAQGYSELLEQFKLTQEEIAKRVGKSRAVVANALRLLKLDSEIQTHLREGRLSVGHAKVILGLTAPAEQKLAVERILKQGLNVRQTEELVGHLQGKASITAPAPGGKTNGAAVGQRAGSHIADLENKIRERVGTKVRLRYRQGKGFVQIQFFSDDELERLLEILGIKVE